MSSNAIATARTGIAPLAERWYVLIVMCVVYAINIAARYVVTTVFEPIRLELKLSDTGGAFLTGPPLALFYVVCGIPIAWLADRSNRRNIVAASLIVWSAFTTFCGLAPTFWQFLIGRIGAGVGEAGATPPSTSLVSDCFPAERRAMALSVFALGAPIGAWLASDVAGAVAQSYGWRGAFYALGVPGVLLGVLFLLTIREPKRGQLDAVAAEGKASFAGALTFLWRQRAAFHVIMGAGVCSLWGWGLVWWTPTFLQRTYGLNVAQAGALTGHIHLFGGILASVAAAWLMSRPFMRAPRRVLLALGLVTGCTTIPSIIAYWTHSLWLARMMFWVYIPAIYFFIGPCMALVANLAPSHMRAAFTAWSGLVGNVLNLIVAVQAIGLLSDWFAGAHGSDAASLRWALLLLAPTGFWATWHFYLASRTVDADLQRVGHSGASV
ncbi:MAG TPA: MFS transporter [Steroidobacteraceae bacterium]|nr:MFS transporter [Steroidobacteraceae bacterium]HEV2443325.1 MFS transporter [Steroidobacteraceae bacterium]